ncbi:hypothetical protein DFH08DRAFT_831794 [Mycena albidolilacea]|uniref:DUF6534 domain-containing protein n=1 Tax=Mycena albidolilacea TaxID=1033008 RepID=A0AAD7F7B8_9AGAR|nr:hypothetical protein DFH08DRAFT_831794 [Mycena albidolilacea]
MSNINSSVRVSQQPNDYNFVIPGAILMDGLIHSFCLGFVLALGLKYWEEYTEDSIRKRAFVLAVVLLSFLQTVLEDYKVWTIALFHQSWAASGFLWTDFFLNAAICSICEAFYIRRCWKMTGKSPWVLYPMLGLWFSVVGAQSYVVITLGLEFQEAKVIKADHILLDEKVEHLFRNTLIVFSYCVVGCTILDVMVAVILIICLWKSKTGLGTSNSVVHRVIFLTLETAFLPSISMVTAVIVLHGAPKPGQNDSLVLFFVFITAKLYAIGLLRTLNARARLRERIGSADLGRTTLDNWSWDQDQSRQETAGKADAVQELTMDPVTVLRGSVESSAPTYTSRVQSESIAPNDVPGSPSAGPSQHVHFNSPLIDQHERGYARLRISSIHRPKLPNHENV